MKKALVVVIGIWLWGTRGSAASGADLGIFGSYWDTKDAEEAFGAGAKLRFDIVELRAAYFNDVTSDVDPEAFDFEVRAIPLEVGLVFRFAKNSPFSPYVGGGVGYYLLDTNAGEIDDEAGFYGVAGAEIGRGMLVFGIEAIYRDIDATVRESVDDFPELEDEVPLDLSGIGVNAGIVWRF